ncbi:hypothetical protein ABQE15_16670 [Enterococcus gallinarum]|uniref:hypothetical protein n=1 Tax=Enterococcus gallinarum TaxID=1353 RepID=UPI0032E40D09
MTEHLKDALEYAVELREGQKVIYEQDEKVFYDTSKARLAELDPIKRAETLTVNSLSGLVDYLKSNIRTLESDTKLLVHVESPTKVVVYSSLDTDRKRESVIQATALLDVFPYRRFMNSEDFIINVQSLIQRDLDAEAILACASSIRIEGGGDLVDNGISQTVTVKEGAATLTKAEVPSPADLRPYRTFLEVEQPSSPFVFRIDKIGNCALFEADGGIWKHTAMENIHEFLNSELDELLKKEVVTIIA